MTKTAVNNTEEYIEDSEQDIRGTDSDNLKTLSEQSDDIKTDIEFYGSFNLQIPFGMVPIILMQIWQTQLQQECIQQQ